MKRFAIVACLLVAGVASLFGQARPGGIARELAMGGSNAGSMLILNPFIMEDPALMLYNPGYQAAYSDYAWANVGGGGLTGLSSTGAPIGDDGYGKQFAGVAFGLTNEWSLGAVLSYDPSAINVVNSALIPAISQRAFQPIPAVANVWEVVLSNRMGSMDWGVGVMYGNSNTDFASTSAAANINNEASSNVWGFRAGIVAPFGAGNSFDASAALRLDKATDNRSNSTPTAATSGKYSASGTELQFTARAKFNVSSKFNFVPYGQFLTISAEPKEDERPNGITSSPASYKASALVYAFGAGGEYRSQGFYFAGGVSWQTLRVKTESSPPTPAGGTNPGTTTNTTTYSAIPVLNLGGEWWFLDWLAGRSGYYRSLGKINSKNEPPAGGGPTTESNTSFANSLVFIGGLSGANYDGLVTMGLGFKFGGASIDATISEEALRRGLGLIGASDNINTFGYLTASYAFGE